LKTKNVVISDTNFLKILYKFPGIPGEISEFPGIRVGLACPAVGSRQWQEQRRGREILHQAANNEPKKSTSFKKTV